MWRSLVAAVLALSLSAGAARAQFPAELRGRVLSVEQRTPVPGATVELTGSGQRAVTGADGGFHMRGLPPGRHELRVLAFGYQEHRGEVRLENGRVQTVSVEIAPSPLTVEGVVARAEALPGATRVTRRAIEASGARDLAELVQAQPGITVVRRGGPGSPATVSIRGSSADEVLVLLDGVPLNSPLTGEADLSTIPLEAVERVTVLRGGQSARYGARALAGVLLVETRRPTAGEMGLRAGAGAWGERWSAATIGGRAPLGGARLNGLVAGEWRSVLGNFPFAVPRVRGGGVAERANGDALVVSVLAQSSLESASGTALRVRAEGLRVERGMPGSIVQPARAARQEQRRRSLVLGLAGGGAGAGWRLDLDAQEQDASYRDPTPPLGPAYDDHVRVSTRGGVLSASASPGPLSLAAGLEARRMEFASSMLATGAPDGQQLAGGWLQGRIPLPAPAAWAAELQPSLRADRSSLLEQTVLSPRVGATLGRGSLSARLSAGSAFSPPSLADQFFQEGVLARPNPDLEPERVRWEVEAGMEARDLPAGTARLDAELSVFRADVDGMILWFPDHRFVWQPDNFDVRRRGWEAGSVLRFPWRAAELRASISDARVEYTGRVLSGQVRYRPRWTAAAAAGAALAGARAELSGRYVGERRTVPGAALNALPSYWLADLRLSRHQRWGTWHGDVSAALENLFDREAAMLVDYPFPGRAWSLSVRVRRESRRVAKPGAVVIPS